MRHDDDPRVVLTLDAGGTCLAFSAIRGNRPCGEPVVLPSAPDDLRVCLARIVEGFESVLAAAGGEACALSFAFPGPADYRNGIIGDLGNLPGFRGGVPLGPLLHEHFRLPVFVNNDGDLFALGEAMAGFLPWLNGQLSAVGSALRYRNLLGVTIGTGFGGGIVHDGRLLLGDNGAAGEIWLVRNKLDPDTFAEEGVSARAVRRAYADAAGISSSEAPEPQEIAAIAAGEHAGHRAAAAEAFRRLGEVAGDALANAATLLDAPIVVGGGLAGAASHFLPALVGELNSTLLTRAGHAIARLESRAYNVDSPDALAEFVRGDAREIAVPGSRRSVTYDPAKRLAVGLSRLGTARAVALGAYAFALDTLDTLDALDTPDTPDALHAPDTPDAPDAPEGRPAQGRA